MMYVKHTNYVTEERKEKKILIILGIFEWRGKKTLSEVVPQGQRGTT